MEHIWDALCKLFNLLTDLLLYFWGSTLVAPSHPLQGVLAEEYGVSLVSPLLFSLAWAGSGLVTLWD